MRQSTDPLRKREKLLEEESRRSSNASLKSVRFDEEQLKTPATVVADDSEESEDEEFKPDEDSESISTESNKENLEPESAVSISFILHSYPTLVYIFCDRLVSTNSGARPHPKTTIRVCRHHLAVILSVRIHHLL